MAVSIRSAGEGDGPSLARIYNHYVSATCITFETALVTARDMADRINATRDAALPWFVAEASGDIVGYAYATRWKGRAAYRFSVESSVYLDPECSGKGIGRQLYIQLIDALRALSMHSVIGGITLPNEPSIALHEQLGFKKVGHFEQVGYKQDRWIDVGYWQLLL